VAFAFEGHVGSLAMNVKDRGARNGGRPRSSSDITPDLPLESPVNFVDNRNPSLNRTRIEDVMVGGATDW
jgi:hypothetical protein